MDKVQLQHPEGKKAIRMDAGKYDCLRKALLHCLQQSPGCTFDQLEVAVEAELVRKQEQIEGKFGWNLFWVSLDLEAQAIIRRDRKVSPMTYFLGN